MNVLINLPKGSEGESCWPKQLRKYVKPVRLKAKDHTEYYKVVSYRGMSYQFRNHYNVYWN